MYGSVSSRRTARVSSGRGNTPPDVRRKTGVGSGIHWGKFTANMFLKSLNRPVGHWGPFGLPASLASKGQGGAFSAKVEEGEREGWNENQMRWSCSGRGHAHARARVSSRARLLL